uniref:Facilitated trehalose transporter Tret1 n=1 Tax=Cacopsylla melanoneura TaxID=428564 RepID=A0A8D9ABQ0_9HEMI
MFKVTTSGVVRQFFAGYSACLLGICYGSSIGWLSPIQTFLESNQSPVGQLTEYHIAWLASIPYLGSIVGTFLFARISECIGRKTMLFGLGVPYLSAGLLIYFTRTFVLMLMARFVIGVCIPGTLSSISLYIAEISDASIRGNLGSGVFVFCNMGVLSMFLSGAYLSYYTYNMLPIVLPGLCLTVFWFLPESPIYYLKIDRIDESRKVLSWLKATSDDSILDEEIEKLRSMFFEKSSTEEAARQRRLTWREIFTTRYYRRAFLLGIILMSTNCCTGILIMNVFAYTVLAQCFNVSAPGTYTAFFSLVENSAGILALFLTHRFTRKFILVGTRLVLASSAFAIGLTLLIRDLYSVSVHPYVFIVLFTVYNASLGFGLTSIVFVILGELFSVECRDKLLQALLLLHFSLGSVYVTAYPISVKHIHLYSWFFIFSFVTFTLTTILIVYLPETGGKTVTEIAQEITATKRRKNDSCLELTSAESVPPPNETTSPASDQCGLFRGAKAYVGKALRPRDSWFDNSMYPVGLDNPGYTITIQTG